MKRMLIIFISILALLRLPHAAVPDPEPTAPAEISPPDQSELSTTVPCSAADAPLRVLSLGDYEGAFLEDETDTPVCCACLLVENTGDKLISYARIRLHDLIFELSYLPPHSKLMVLERNRRPFSLLRIDDCVYEAVSFLPAGSSDQVYVSPDGQQDMIATNLTAGIIPLVEIRYKQYIPESDMYLGGITYSIVLESLSPEESRRITPYHYLTDRGIIVAVYTP